MEKEKKSSAKKKLIAKRDFLINCNELKLQIKKGDDLAKRNLDAKFIRNLIAEKVI